MRTVIVSIIGISSLFLVVLIQKNVTAETWEKESLEVSLTDAMDQTLSEVMEGNRYGIENRNEMMAAFLQAMIRRMEKDVDLTVKVHKIDYELGQMDVEVIGKNTEDGERGRSISLRRKMVFTN